MTGGGQLNALIEQGLYGNNRLRFNNELLNQAYLAKAAQAAQQLEPRQASALGLYSDQGPPQGFLEQYLADQSGTVDKGQRIPDLLNVNTNSPRLDPAKEWHWLSKRQVKG